MSSPIRKIIAISIVIASCIFIAACGDSDSGDIPDTDEVGAEIKERLVQADLKPVEEVAIDEKTADAEKPADDCSIEDEGCTSDRP